MNGKKFMSVANRSDGPVLAIVCPQLGAASETFIKKHIDLIAPKRTVVLTGAILDSAWISCPVKQIPIAIGEYRFSPDSEAEVLSFLQQMAVTHILCEFGCIGGALLGLNRATLHLPAYVHFHGQDASEFLRMPEIVDYYRWVGKTVDGVIAVSQPMSDRLIDIGIPAYKLRVIHSGVDVPKDNCSHPEVEPCRLIAVSRLIPKKGLLQTLMAFEHAMAEERNITLDIIGEGPMQSELETYIERHELQSGVTLHGILPHAGVLATMCESSAFVQHSMADPQTGNREGLPVSLLEAAAHALPIVSTRHEGIPEAVDDGLSGFLVDEGDWPAMADRIVELAKDPMLRKRMGLAGRKKIVDCGFSTKAMISELRRFMGFVEYDFSC
jgi:colanic acid/amylovoran biosynthesis glycosyltransferase